MLTQLCMPGNRIHRTSLFRFSLLLITAAALLVWSPVVSANGLGSITESYVTFTAGQQEAPLSLTFVTNEDMTNGVVSFTMPEGWTMDGTPTASNYPVAVQGSNTVTISQVTMTAGASLAISATVNASPTVGEFVKLSVSQAATEGGALTELQGARPWLITTAPSGVGTVTLSQESFNVYTTGTFGITYTFPTNSGEMVEGEVEITLPDGWSLNPAGANVTNHGGAFTISGRTLTASGVHLGGGSSIMMQGEFTIGGTGSPVTFAARQKTNNGQSLTALQAPASAVVVDDLTNLDSLYTSLGNVWPKNSTFDSTVTSYAVSAASTATQVTVTVNAKRPWDNIITLKALGQDDVQGTSGTFNLSDVGDTTISVVLHPNLTPAVDGLPSKTYTITVRRLAESGSGTITANPLAFGPGQTGAEMTYVYTAAGYMQDGMLLFRVPAAWASQPGVFTSDKGVVQVSGNESVYIMGLTMEPGEQVTVTYSNATAPVEPGSYPFNIYHYPSTDCGCSAQLTPVTVDVVGNGTGQVAAFAGLSPGQNDAELTFTYVAANSMVNGTLSFTVPNHMTLVSTPTASPATVVAVDGVVTISGINLQAGQGLAVTSIVNVSEAAVTSSLNLMQASTALGTLTAVPTNDVASVQVLAPSGGGTMTLSKSTLSLNPDYHGTYEELTATYTAASAMVGGRVSITIPVGWTFQAQQSANLGSTTFDGNTATITGLSLNPGETVTLNLFVGRGTETGPVTLEAKQSSGNGGSMVALAESPVINQLAPAGTGSAAFLNAGRVSAATDFVLRYTAAAGGMVKGTLQLVVPTGWELNGTPVASHGTTPVVFGAPKNVNISNITLAENESMTITMSVTTLSTVQVVPWTIYHASMPSVGMLAMPNQPSIALYPAGEQGAISFTAPLASLHQTNIPLTFTYTSNFDMYLGDIEVTNLYLYTMTSTPTTTVGTVTNTDQVLRVSGLTLRAGDRLPLALPLRLHPRVRLTPRPPTGRDRVDK